LIVSSSPEFLLISTQKGEDGADYKETLILGKEGVAKMARLRTGKLGRCLA